MHDFPPRLKTAEHEDEDFRNPDWGPLERLADPELVGWYMWMNRSRLTDGTVIHAYKHRATRRYTHLSEDGRAFVYLGFIEDHLPSGYHETTLVSALITSLGEWECLMPWPDDMPAMRRHVSDAIHVARGFDEIAAIKTAA